MTYTETYNRSLADKEAFWLEQARSIAWYRFPEKALSLDEHSLYRWFEGEQREVEL